MSWNEKFYWVKVHVGPITEIKDIHVINWKTITVEGELYHLHAGKSNYADWYLRVRISKMLHIVCTINADVFA